MRICISKHDTTILKQIKCEVIVKKTSPDAREARYETVFVGPHCKRLNQSLNGGVMGQRPYTRGIYYYYGLIAT